jgi:hypothetical protein
MNISTEHPEFNFIFVADQKIMSLPILSQTMTMATNRSARPLMLLQLL